METIQIKRLANKEKNTEDNLMHISADTQEKNQLIRLWTEADSWMEYFSWSLYIFYIYIIYIFKIIHNNETIHCKNIKG